MIRLFLLIAVATLLCLQRRLDEHGHHADSRSRVRFLATAYFASTGPVPLSSYHREHHQGFDKLARGGAGFRPVFNSVTIALRC